MGDRVGYVVYHREHGFLVDNCAGGAWTEDRREAQVFDNAHLASEAYCVLEAMGMDFADVTFLEWITLG